MEQHVFPATTNVKPYKLTNAVKLVGIPRQNRGSLAHHVLVPNGAADSAFQCPALSAPENNFRVPSNTKGLGTLLRILARLSQWSYVTLLKIALNVSSHGHVNRRS